MVIRRKPINDQDYVDPLMGATGTTLRKSFTGLPVNIWVDDDLAYKDSGHGIMLKFQPDRGDDRPLTRSFAAMTVSNSPEVMGEHTLSGEEIQSIKDFVSQNKEDLVALANREIGIEDFLQLLLPHQGDVMKRNECYKEAGEC